MPTLHDVLEHRYSILGLISLDSIAWIAFEAIVRSLQLNIQIKWHIFVWIALWMALWIVWAVYRKYLPKNKKHKFSMVVSVTTDDSMVRSRSVADFKDQIDKQISGSDLQNSLNLIVLDNHQASNINACIDRIYLKKANCDKDRKFITKIMSNRRYNLIISSRMKKRNSGEAITVTTQIALLGRELKRELSNHVYGVINNVWIPSIRFPEKVELDGSTAVADYYFICSVYLVGLAALLSEQIVDSLQLYERLLAFKGSVSSKLVVERDPRFFNKIEMAISQLYVQLGRKTLDSEADLEKSWEYSERSLRYHDNYDAYLLRGIICFEKGRNIERAIVEINKAKSIQKNGIWKYSMAFLLFYENKEDGLTYYSSLAKSTFPGEIDVVEGVVLHIEKVLNVEPHRYTLYFALGYLCYKKLMQYDKGIACMSSFLENSTLDDKSLLKRRARTYMEEMKRFR